jgi:putative Ca2+/H+ antiporter (TMEM165/GDT1 family)
VEAILVSLAVVFVAEIGDKSQLMALSFATRLPLLPVLGGIACATALLTGLSVAVGNLAGELIPDRVALGVSAVLFVAFGFWALRGPDEAVEEDEARGARSLARLPFLAVFFTFTLAEIGDKTMLATVTLAANAPALATWTGATAGMLGANLLAVGLGRAIGVHVPERLLRLFSAVMFFALAAVLGARAVLAG